MINHLLFSLEWKPSKSILPWNWWCNGGILQESKICTALWTNKLCPCNKSCSQVSITTVTLQKLFIVIVTITYKRLTVMWCSAFKKVFTVVLFIQSNTINFYLWVALKTMCYYFEEFHHWLKINTSDPVDPSHVKIEMKDSILRWLCHVPFLPLGAQSFCFTEK